LEKLKLEAQDKEREAQEKERVESRVSNPVFTEPENPGYPGFFKPENPGFSCL